MKGLFAPLLLSILLTSYAVSHASDAPLPDTAVPGPRTPIDVDHTASIVGIQIGTRLAAFIFISKDGKHQNIGADECAQSVKCRAIMAELGKQGRTDLLHFEPSHEGDAPPVIDDVPMQLRPGVLTDVNLLPHRSFQEIDIQGHQAGTPEDLCPGQIRENVPQTGLFLYCWGRKP